MTKLGFCIFCHNHLGRAVGFVTYRSQDLCYECLGEIMKVAQLSKAMTEADSQKKATGEDIGYRYRC